MWQEDSEYLRNVDTDVAFPQSLQEIASDGLLKGRRSNSVSFMLRTVQDDRLIGFVAIHGIEWNNRTGLLAIGIGDANDRGKGYGREAIHLILKYAFMNWICTASVWMLFLITKLLLSCIKDGFSNGRLYERSSAKRWEVFWSHDYGDIAGWMDRAARLESTFEIIYVVCRRYNNNWRILQCTDCIYKELCEMNLEKQNQ